MWQEESCLLKNKVYKQGQTSYQEDTGGNIALVWLKFICRNQQSIVMNEDLNCASPMEIQYHSGIKITLLLPQHNLYSLQNLHDITLLYCIIKVMFYTYILDSVFSNAGCCHTNLMYLNDRQQKEHINNWTTLANW